ncbi:MAG: ankyrin repeat domain-containing protein [Leptospiraceae bacterium]|nr:ankyrin repeat domain-containing protein [Leptospiraceae bacterium]
MEIQNLKCIQTKIQKGEFRYEDFSRKSSTGRTTLHYSVEAKNFDLVKMIVANNASSRITDDYGNTASIRAVPNQRQMVEILTPIHSDLEINKADRNGETVLDIANARIHRISRISCRKRRSHR